MKNTITNRKPIYLIINADDYGYYTCVSRGILAAAEKGIVTATGIFANSRLFDEHIKWLAPISELDVGVHLNLTNGRPLDLMMKKYLTKWNGEFPDKLTMAVSILTRKISLTTIMNEWRAQIERCLNAGLKLQFLNSHEHIHMLPSLFKLVKRLADEYKIPHIRITSAEWIQDLWVDAIARNLVISGLSIISKWNINMQTPIMIGLAKSGKLDYWYLKNRITSLKSGKIYELMCHPGYYDSDEIMIPHLLSYHEWESELQFLLSDQMSDLLDNYNIRLIGYRNIKFDEKSIHVSHTGD